MFPTLQELITSGMFFLKYILPICIVLSIQGIFYLGSAIAMIACSDAGNCTSLSLFLGGILLGSPCIAYAWSWLSSRNKYHAFLTIYTIYAIDILLYIILILQSLIIDFITALILINIFYYLKSHRFNIIIT